MKKYGFETLALHSGVQPDPTTGASTMPIYQSSSFVFENTEHAEDLFALRKVGNIYSRIGNPTVAAFEERIAALEGGVGRLPQPQGRQPSPLLCSTSAHLGMKLWHHPIYTVAH